jgi:hypothetical protein
MAWHPMNMLNIHLAGQHYGSIQQKGKNNATLTQLSGFYADRPRKVTMEDSENMKEKKLSLF